MINSCCPFCTHRKVRLIRNTVVANSVPVTAKSIQQKVFSRHDFFVSSIRIVSDPYISDSLDSLESGVPAKNPPGLRRISISAFLATVISLSFEVEVIQNPGDNHYNQSQTK